MNIPLILLAVASVLLIGFALLPAETIPPAVLGPTVPSVEHFLAYLVYGVLLVLATRFKGAQGYLTLVLAGGAFGLFTEALQLAVPGRMFDHLDVLMNTFGVTVGATAIHVRTKIQ